MPFARLHSLSRWALPCLLATLLTAPQLLAATTVFMDYSGFSTRLETAASSAGVAPFTPAEQSTMKGIILDYLTTAFNGFDLSFSEVSPGGSFPTLSFSLTGGGFGVADHIDYRNKEPVDVALVFTANFDSFIEANDPREDQIDELAISLAGTSAHELGHNLGLRHHDSYGNPGIVYSGSPINTGGIQNTHIMATGSTGLSEAERETPRTFSEHSLVKLSYAEGINAAVPKTVLELGDFGNTTAMPTPVAFSPLDVVDRRAVNIAGQINSTSDPDVFSFPLQAGSRFSADVNVDFAGSVPFENVNTMIEFIDTDGVTVIASDLVTEYSSDTLGSGNSGDGFDPWLLNIPIPTTGTYYLRVSPEDPDTGDYELLMHTDGQALVGPDFNGNGLLECADIDALVEEISTGADDAMFDLTGDGQVDVLDRDAWLAAAGMENLPSGSPYLLGDANLDGRVDGADFIEWNSNKFSAFPAWCGGDFNADGLVDGQDFVIWNDNKFQDVARPGVGPSGLPEFGSAPWIDLPPAAAVPEPTGGGVAACSLILLGFWRRRALTTPLHAASQS